MKSRGFAYSPQLATATNLNQSAAAASGLTGFAYAERWGFGISTNYLQTTEAPSDALVQQLAAATAAHSSNEAIVAELSESGRVEWSMTLEGLTDDDGSRVPGCAELAHEEFGLAPILQFEFEDALRDYSSRVQAHPKFVSARQTYQQCFLRKGFGVEDEGQARAEIFEQLDDLIRRAEDAAGPASISIGESEVRLNPRMDGSLADELAVLQDYEREVAIAHLECLNGGEPSLASVTAELQTVFVQENEALVASVGGS